MEFAVLERGDIIRVAEGGRGLCPTCPGQPRHPARSRQAKLPRHRRRAAPSQPNRGRGVAPAPSAAAGRRIADEFLRQLGCAVAAVPVDFRSTPRISRAASLRRGRRRRTDALVLEPQRLCSPTSPPPTATAAATTTSSRSAYLLGSKGSSRYRSQPAQPLFSSRHAVAQPLFGQKSLPGGFAGDYQRVGRRRSTPLRLAWRWCQLNYGDGPPQPEPPGLDGPRKARRRYRRTAHRPEALRRVGGAALDRRTAKCSRRRPPVEPARWSPPTTRCPRTGPAWAAPLPGQRAHRAYNASWRPQGQRRRRAPEGGWPAYRDSRRTRLPRTPFGRAARPQSPDGLNVYPRDVEKHRFRVYRTRRGSSGGGRVPTPPRRCARDTRRAGTRGQRRAEPTSACRSRQGPPMSCRAIGQVREPAVRNLRLPRPARLDEPARDAGFGPKSARTHRTTNTGRSAVEGRRETPPCAPCGETCVGWLVEASSQPRLQWLLKPVDAHSLRPQRAAHSIPPSRGRPARCCDPSASKVSA